MDDQLQIMEEDSATKQAREDLKVMLQATEAETADVTLAEQLLTTIKLASSASIEGEVYECVAAAVRRHARSSRWRYCCRSLSRRSPRWSIWRSRCEARARASATTWHTSRPVRLSSGAA